MAEQTIRYSKEELEEFRLLIEKKLDTTRSLVTMMESQIMEINENEENHGTDIVDDSSNSVQLEMLNTLIGRQRLYIQDLEFAMIRIRNKSYGICQVSGQLIDKKRLVVVLTTTISHQGKNILATPKK